MMRAVYAWLLPIGPIRVTANYAYAVYAPGRWHFYWVGWPEQQRRSWWEGVRRIGPLLTVLQRGRWVIHYSPGTWYLHGVRDGGPGGGFEHYTFRLGLWRFLFIRRGHWYYRCSRPIALRHRAAYDQETAFLDYMAREHNNPPGWATIC